MNEKENTNTIWNRYYIITVLINVMIAFSFYMVSSIMSKYLTGIGIDVAVAGVIVGLFSITSLVCRPFSGVLADRISNVTLLRISNILMAIGLTGFAFVKDTALLVVFRIINGAGFALLGTSVITLATKFIPENRRGEGIGYLGLGMALASAVAPGFGIMVADVFGMKATFLIAAGLCVLAIVMLIMVKEPKSEKSAANGKVSVSIKDLIAAEAIPYTLMAGTFSFINGIVAAYLVLFADELGIGGISTYFTVSAVMLMVARPLSGKLMDKKGIATTVIPGMILAIIGMFMLGRASTLTTILISGALRSFGQGAAQPSLQVGCINKCGKGRSGVATSTYYLGGDIFQGAAPMLGGVLIGMITGIKGYRLSFDLSAILLICALAGFVVYQFLLPGKRAADSSER